MIWTERNNILYGMQITLRQTTRFYVVSEKYDFNFID